VDKHRGEGKQLTTVWTLKHSKDVHGAGLSDRLVEQPQELLVPESGGCALRDEPGGIVETELKPARAAGPRAHLVAHRKEGDALAPRVADVRTRRREDDVERRVTRRGHTERGPRPDEGRPDVKAAPPRLRDPSGVERDQALDEGEESV